MKDMNYLKRHLKGYTGKFLQLFGIHSTDLIRSGYKLARLRENTGYGKSGDLCLVKHCKEYIEANVNGYEYPSPGGWTGCFEWSHVTCDGKYMAFTSIYTLKADILDVLEVV